MFEEEFRTLLNKTVGIQNILTFREDFREGFLERVDLTNTKINRRKAIKEIENAPDEAKRRQKKFEFAVTVIGGLLFFLLGLIYGQNLWISALTLYAIFFPLEVIFRKVTIDILAYDSVEPRMSNEQIEFMRAWNNSILHNVLSIAGAPLVALLMQVNKDAYEWGMVVGLDIMVKWA